MRYYAREVLRNAKLRIPSSYFHDMLRHDASALLAYIPAIGTRFTARAARNAGLISRDFRGL